MISRKEIIIPSPRARLNTFHGNAVRIDRREKEGEGGGGGSSEGGEVSKNCAKEKNVPPSSSNRRPCPERSDEIG